MSTENKTKFWVVCCEETQATHEIAKAVADWQLPGVSSLVTSELTEAETLAQSEYAIFVTTHPRPSSQINVSPLSLAQVIDSTGTAKSASVDHLASESPASESPASKRLDIPMPVSQLIGLHQRYGQSPQSWWFELPTSEVRAQKLQPVSTEKSVAQALNQIEVFVRNYTRSQSFTPPISSAPIASPGPVTISSAQHELAADKTQASKTQASKTQVTARPKATVLHYRRI